jgi:uncharacterized protein YdaU (DUF1376 family)
MHYYQFHINDFIGETHFLNNHETSIYLKLFNHYLHEEKPLKNNMIFLQRLCGGTEDEVQNVLNLFFELKEDSWHRESLDFIIHEYQSKKEANSRGGKKSALIRKQKLADKSSLSVLQLTNNNKPLIINQEPEINKEETLTKEQLTNDLQYSESIFLEQFEEFWNIYPKKVGKEAARKEWLRLKPDLEKVKKSLGWQRSCKEWRNEDGRYIPYPSKYLLEQRWQDERKREPWEGCK